MVIETKFEIGDRVFWFKDFDFVVHSEDGGLTSGVVDGFEYGKESELRLLINWGDDNCSCVPEHLVFRSKSEALISILEVEKESIEAEISRKKHRLENIEKQIQEMAK